MAAPEPSPPVAAGAPAETPADDPFAGLNAGASAAEAPPAVTGEPVVAVPERHTELLALGEFVSDRVLERL